MSSQHHGVRRASLPDPGQEGGGWGAPPAQGRTPGGGPPILALMEADVQSAERQGGQGRARPHPPRQQPEHHLARRRRGDQVQ